VDEVKRVIADKKRELQAHFDKLVSDGCTCTVLRHEILPHKPRTLDKQEVMTTFIVDALIVLRVVPVIDGAGNISRWRFRLYFRPIGWDDGFHSHHRMEIVDYRQRFHTDPLEMVRDSYIYMIGAGDYAMWVQSFPNPEPDEREIIRDARDWRAYKAERVEYFNRMEKQALEWELGLMEDEDANSLHG
jgi:hypothetical protein